VLQPLRHCVLGFNARAFDDLVGLRLERDHHVIRDRELVDDSLDAGNLERDLFRALSIGFGAHHAVERRDAEPNERAQVSDVERLRETRLNLEPELRVADVGLSCGFRCSRRLEWRRGERLLGRNDRDGCATGKQRKSRLVVAHVLSPWV
jgi:hypothetical protein